MKEVIILVGNMGAGKSRLADEIIKGSGPSVVRISQDDQGKVGHWKDYERALKDDVNTIIIDRINHIREQRANYINAAKKRDYHTRIIDITCDPKTAFQRITERKEHATLGSDDKDTILKALYMYYSQYEEPYRNEADTVISNTTFNPYMLDLTDKLSDKHYMIIGDLHGCYKELSHLLTGKLPDVLIACGDLIDRGPNISAVLKTFMYTPNMYSVLGNHEYKFLRYLIGNKVTVSHGLEKTIEQTKDMDKYGLALYLMSLPKIIKVNDNYIVHAGINPNYSMDRQQKHSLLYARDWAKSSNLKDMNVFYGHHYSEKTDIAPNVYALDGHCVYGGELRAMLMPEKKLIIQKAFETYLERKEEAVSIMDEFEQEVTLGNVRKTVKGDLVLYCYTQKCNYEKNWNEITKQARGVIFNRITGECIAKPFYKFFNLNEVEETRLENLPKESYEVFDKVDGSLGILYWQGDQPMIATKGSFDSPQAYEAMKILIEKGYHIHLKDFSKDITLLFEIIYPENRQTPGAILVSDYGKTRDLILLAGINRKSNVELSREELDKISEKMGFPLVVRYNHTIEEMIQMQKTLPKEREGFVVRFPNRLRVKIKGDEYMKIHRLLNNMTPLFLWENMTNGVVPNSLKQEVPEEYRNYMEGLVSKLESRYKDAWFKILDLMETIDPMWRHQDSKNKEFMKKVGLTMKDKDFEFKEVVFPMILGKEDVVEKLIMKRIRPENNIL